MFEFLKILMFFSNLSFSSEVTEAYNNLRSLSMGGAGVAITSGIEALFVNPAGLNNNQGIVATVLSPSISSNTAAYETVKDYKSLTDGDSIVDYIQPHVGKNYGLGVDNITGIALKNLALAWNFQISAYEVFHNLALPEIELNTYYRNTLKGGASIGLLDDEMLKLGIALKYSTMRGKVGSLKTEQLLTMTTDELKAWIDNSGYAYGLDVGCIFEIPYNKIVKTSFGVAWQDVFTTKYRTRDTFDEATAYIPDNLTAGFGAVVDLPGLDIKFAFDVKHITDTNIQIPLKIHFGTELDFPLVNIRAGINQGYYTLGADFELFLFNIELVSYGEELGSYPGHKVDRRYALKITSSLSLFN